MSPKSQPMDIYERRGQLIDKSFLEGLTDEEEAELKDIESRVDEADAAYYAPAIAALRTALERLRGNSTT